MKCMNASCGRERSGAEGEPEPFVATFDGQAEWCWLCRPCLRSIRSGQTPLGSDRRFHWSHYAAPLKGGG